jgi:hypothetical protein
MPNIINPLPGFTPNPKPKRLAESAEPDETAATFLDNASAAVSSITPLTSLSQIQLRPKPVRKRALIVVIITSIVILAGVAAALILTGVISFASTMKTTQYTATDGTRYEMRFYADSKTEKILREMALVSNVSKDNKAPIYLTIRKLTTNANRRCDENMPKAFDVKNSPMNQTITVCKLGQRGILIVYVALFNSRGADHTMLIAQDVQSELGNATYEEITSFSSVEELAESWFGLTPYDADIKHIISSIKVLN